MRRTKVDSRARLVQAAEKTAYRYGFGSTAIADIAKEARIPVGNVYYYFKTKDDIGSAIIELRGARFRKLLEQLRRPIPPGSGYAGSYRSRSRTAPSLRAAAAPSGRCAPNCKS